MPAVAEVLSEAGIGPSALERIVCGAGPGSFTSLRIAASIAKGIATGIGRPLFAVSSLALTVAADRRAPGRYLSVLSALRGESFVQDVEVTDAGRVRVASHVRLVEDVLLPGMAEEQSARLIGPGQPLDVAPLARGVARVERALFDAPVDLVSWEPRYGRAAEAQVRWEAAHGRPLPHG